MPLPLLRDDSDARFAMLERAIISPRRRLRHDAATIMPLRLRHAALYAIFAATLRCLLRLPRLLRLPLPPRDCRFAA